VELFPAWEVDLLVFNEALPYFADRHVRRAITHAIKPGGARRGNQLWHAKPGGSFFPPSLQYYDPNTPVLNYSLSSAKAELAQSKYRTVRDEVRSRAVSKVVEFPRSSTVARR